ncbi:hypothetical protein WAF17_01310 [Bernardetia sp. ABR2-2B]|uniref:hypothetical protein n=1 Tax=Bernardetia sp. ABR2-2B TaxID=3127472 RepID=UPI0030CB7EA6
MGTFKVDGRMTVNTLKDKFKETFGYSLRVYKGNNAGRGARFADDKTRLGEVADERESVAGMGEFDMPSEMTIAEFEKLFQEKFDIAVQVADADNEKLLDNDATLKAN